MSIKNFWIFSTVVSVCGVSVCGSGVAVGVAWRVAVGMGVMVAVAVGAVVGVAVGAGSR